MTSGGFRVSDSTIETAAAAACIEADWTWTVAVDEHILSPMECMTPIVAAALTAALPSLVAEIEQSVRERIVNEIEAAAQRFDVEDRWAMSHAAAVARGDAG